jgi:hypothetical protein
MKKSTNVKNTNKRATSREKNVTRQKKKKIELQPFNSKLKIPNNKP